MNAFFHRLQRHLFPGSYYLGSMAEDSRRTHRLVREINKHAWERSAPFLRQLEFLAKPESDRAESPLPSLHHDLALVASWLETEVRETGKDAPCVCQIAIGEEYRASMAACLDSARAYCEKNGYNHVVVKERPHQFDRHLFWLKFPLLWKAMEMGFQDIFYLDTDALVTNPSVKLEPFFQRLHDQNREILITRDKSGVNCGIYFIRKSLKSQVLLNLFWENRSYSYTWLDFGDQSTFHDLLNSYPVMEKCFLQAGQRDFNSYLDGGPAGTWQEGDFIIHFAGANKAQMNEFIRRHSHQNSR